MPRPTSKDELLTAIEKERGKLEALLEDLSPYQMTLSGVVGGMVCKGCAGAPDRMGADVPGVVPRWTAWRSTRSTGAGIQVESNAPA